MKHIVHRLDGTIVETPVKVEGPFLENSVRWVSIEGKAVDVQYVACSEAYYVWREREKRQPQEHQYTVEKTTEVIAGKSVDLYAVFRYGERITPYSTKATAERKKNLLLRG